jgi:hypothetical protein
MFDFIFSSVQPVSLDGGPEFYNCWSCPHNCVGGSENGCPTPAPAPPPHPASWYSATETSQLASSPSQVQSLESGPEFYNCASCPHNCVGGSENGCPSTAAVPPPKPSSWYSATPETAQLAGSQPAAPVMLDAGPEFYNCYSCSHNCVGGSEQGCIPGRPEASVIVHDPSKMSQLAVPVAAASAEAGKTVRPGVSHVYNLGPAMILGALSATAEAGSRLLSGAGDDCQSNSADGVEAWIARFRAGTDEAAGAVTPLGQHILRKHIFVDAA